MRGVFSMKEYVAKSNLIGRNKRCRAGPIALAASFGLGLLSFTSSSAVASDRERAFEDRQESVIQALASRYAGRTDWGDCQFVRFGMESMYLLAALEAERRGMDGGVALDEVLDDLRSNTALLVERLGVPGDPGIWSWDQTGSPAIKHSALAFGFVLHQWKDELPEAIRENIRLALQESTWKDDASQYLVNGRLSVMAAELLAGEALGYESELWEKACRQFNRMYDYTMSHGGLEMNGPIYSAYHYPPLTFLQKLEHEEIRNKARILMDNQLTVAGHLFVPDSGIGTPRSRDRSGAVEARGTLTQHYAAFFGTPAMPSSSNMSWHLIAAVGDYQPPAIIESFFTEKETDNGFDFWAYSPAPLGSRIHNAAYDLGPNNATVSPWHAVTAPAGNAVMGIAYGHRGMTHHISMGVWVRDADGGYQIYYHHNPIIAGDTTDVGGRMLGGPSDDPDDFGHEGHDFQRLMHGQTLISLWDPTLEEKADNVVRAHQDTRARIPNLAEFGGEMSKRGDWYVGRMGETFIAYRSAGRDCGGGTP